MINRDQVRESVLKVAQEVFSRYGFQKTTMEDIAKGMGKGKSSIYYYFSSKDEIFRAVVEKEFVVMKSNIISAVSMAGSPKEKLKAYVMERMQGLNRFVNLYKVLRTEFLGQHDYTDEIRMRTDEEEIRIIKEILDEGVAAETFNLKDTFLTAIAIVTALKGMEIPLLITRDEEQGHMENRLDHLLDVLFYGIRYDRK